MYHIVLHDNVLCEVCFYVVCVQFFCIRVDPSTVGDRQYTVDLGYV